MSDWVILAVFYLVASGAAGAWAAVEEVRFQQRRTAWGWQPAPRWHVPVTFAVVFLLWPLVLAWWAVSTPWRWMK